jgi:hydrogenase expression/formation protein HypD
VRFVDEYREAGTARRLAERIRATVSRPWTLMEVCGGQTHSILRHGIQELLPEGVSLVHGPGCPVCVTPAGLIDQAQALALTPGVLLCSFGDMLRVPGTREDLLSVRARGGRVRVVYSPLDALKLARESPETQVVFFAVGFETTAPATALAVRQAALLGVENFSLLVSHVLVPPAMEAVLDAAGNRVQGFLAAGHVCAVMGCAEYAPIARQYGVPIVVTGFEPVDILEGVAMCVAQLEAGRAEVENQYARSVRAGGNREAQALIGEVFEVAPRHWRGIGPIPRSGLRLREEYARFDAGRRFGLAAEADEAPSECIGGLVLQGVRKPPECPAFGTRCTPERPLGAPMVSSEGACAAYFRYGPAGAKA